MLLRRKNLRFRKYPATCGRLNTIQIRYVWTQVFFKYGGKNLRFRKYPASCGRGLRTKDLQLLNKKTNTLTLTDHPYTNKQTYNSILLKSDSYCYCHCTITKSIELLILNQRQHKEVNFQQLSLKPLPSPLLEVAIGLVPCIRIFLETELFFSGYGFRPHINGFFNRNLSFLKTVISRL